jgi:hypothetical protein
LCIEKLCQGFNFRLELSNTVFLSFRRSKSARLAESYTSFAWWRSSTRGSKLTFYLDGLAALASSTSGLGWHDEEEWYSTLLMLLVVEVAADWTQCR